MCRHGCGIVTLGNAVTEPPPIEVIDETVPETIEMGVLQESCETIEVGEERKHSEKKVSVQRRGRRKGSGSVLNLTVGEWYSACETYLNLPMKMSQADFLKSKQSNPKLTGTRSLQGSFSQMLKKFRMGELQNSTNKRTKKRKFVRLEEMLTDYVNVRRQRFEKNKCGISWSVLREKCLEWGDQLGVENFKASAGWINATLRRYGLEHIKLHGEGDEMGEDEYLKIIGPWVVQLQEMIEENDISPACLYNADQTGLFYQKLPNSTYVKGCKQMTDKSRLTLMVCTAADGKKMPLAIVGKPKRPKCFELGPLPYRYCNEYLPKQA